MAKPTQRQKQFLRALGHKSFDGLTKERASTLIRELLKAEKDSGKTFPCPYCKGPFGPRPHRTKKCPSCGQTIVHLSGKFYTEAQADALNQKEWIKDARKDTRTTVKDDWREERSFRKEYGDPNTIGYLIKIGPDCTASKDRDGLLVMIEDANDTPELLPPYDECRHDTCECDYVPVSPDEVPNDARIAEWSDTEKQEKLKTRSESPLSAENMRKESTGCAGVLLIAVLLTSIAFVLVNTR